ncbi:CRACD-like protein isoform X2 [Pempheris klunzingeri]|uniref:CRACD-like protein isoform X2 n=1 Tax=Pempheris klunzingeri TaxID=3127111 RepID=UPI003980804E
METFSRDTEESTEDIPGRKKSKLKSLKTRLFGRSKRAGGEENAKLSQSASDIAAGEGLGSDEDLVCSQGMMGSRALSHDSIFLADQVLTDVEPARVLSQENVHSKIKALQMKLQQQKFHLGPPPLVLPIRRPEDLESHSEDDGLPSSPSEITGGEVTTQGVLSKTTSLPLSRPLSPIPKPAPTKSVPPTPSYPLPLSAPSNSSIVEAPLDFSSPAQFTPCLDTSAARHRMSVKPRNQRASSKKRLSAVESWSHLHTLNNIDHQEFVREEEQWLSTQEEVALETEQEEAIIPITSQHLRLKSTEVAPITSEAASKAPGLTHSQQDKALPEKVPSVPSQVLRVKPHRPADAMSSERPHSSFIQSEQVQGETESTREIKRPASGSFHFPITTAKKQDGERPRSGSFVGVLEQTEARPKTMSGTEDKPFSSMREKEELRDLQPRGGSFTMGRLRQEGAIHKSSVLPWERRDSLKKVESVMPSKNVTTDTGSVEVEEVESGQEVVEEAEEAQEVEQEQGKTAFGIKLRSTSQSMRFWTDASSNHNSKPPVCEEQCDKQKGQEINDNGSYASKKLFTGDPQLAVKQTLPSTDDPHIMQTEVQTASSNHKEVETAHAPSQQPQPAPQTASSEMSWMTLAMEKTRSLQQLFTSRFPRDFTGVQTAARPKAQAQTTNIPETLTGAQMHTHTVTQQGTTPVEAANQASSNAVKAETIQGRSQAQPVKPSLVAVQQKISTTSPVQSNISREPQTSKQINEPQSHPNTTQSVSQSASHPAVQTNPLTAQSPLQSSTQTRTSSQCSQGSVTQSNLSSGQQQPPWTNRSLHPASQLKSTTSVSTTSPPTGRGEKEATVQEKEGASLSGRRTARVTVSEKAAFLEKRAEWTTLPGTKEVELKKAQTEGESPASAKTTPLSRDAKLEGRQGLKPAESSPTKVPERPGDDKWLRKNAASSSLPSSSPTMPSALQSISDSGQPSWMELAKRKSMAWSDKSMD